MGRRQAFYILLSVMLEQWSLLTRILSVRIRFKALKHFGGSFELLFPGEFGDKRDTTIFAYTLRGNTVVERPTLTGVLKK